MIQINLLWTYYLEGQYDQIDLEITGSQFSQCATLKQTFVY